MAARRKANLVRRLYLPFLDEDSDDAYGSLSPFAKARANKLSGRWKTALGVQSVLSASTGKLLNVNMHISEANIKSALTS